MAAYTLSPSYSYLALSQPNLDPDVFRDLPYPYQHYEHHQQQPQRTRPSSSSSEMSRGSSAIAGSPLVEGLGIELPAQHRMRTTNMAQSSWDDRSDYAEAVMASQQQQQPSIYVSDYPVEQLVDGNLWNTSYLDIDSGLVGMATAPSAFPAAPAVAGIPALQDYHGGHLHPDHADMSMATSSSTSLSIATTQHQSPLPDEMMWASPSSSAGSISAITPDDPSEMGWQDHATGSWRCKHSGCSSTRAFQRACDLRKHYRSHAKNHFCEVEGCPRFFLGFSSEKDCRRHARSHNPDIACLADGCSRVFSRVDNMRKHYETIHTRPGRRSRSRGSRAHSRSRDRSQQPSTYPSPHLSVMDAEGEEES